jgi:hypothetical protein
MEKTWLSEKNIESLKDYYTTAKLFLPKFSNFRVWKFRIDDGTEKGKIIQINDQIRDEKTLRKWLLRYVVRDVYYSSGCFLNPAKVHGDRTKNYPLFKDVPFDLDADEPYGVEQLDIVRISTINLISHINKKLGLDPKHILYTGKKGFQVVYDFFGVTNSELNFTGIDKEVTTDKYRVIRLPLSVNKSGRIAVFLTFEELQKGMDYILKKSKIIYTPQNCEVGVARPNSWSMTESPSAKMLEERGNHPNRPSVTEAIYVTNQIPGTKRYIPILKYNYRDGSRFNPKKELQMLSDKYGLNEWFLIKTSDELYCISLACFDKRRLQKILNSSTSFSKYEFKRLGKIFIRTSKINLIKDQPFPLGIITLTTEKTKDHMYSRPHLDLIHNFNFTENPFIKRYIGPEKPNIFLTTKT